MTPDPGLPAADGTSGTVTCYDCGTANHTQSVFCRDCRDRLRTGYSLVEW